MPFLENLVEGFAGAAGDQNTVGRIENQKSDRRATQYEELHANTSMAIDEAKQLWQAKSDPNLAPEKVAAIDKRLGELQRHLSDLYHPEKNPGALSHLGNIIKSHFGKKQAQVPQTPGQAKQQFSWAGGPAGTGQAAAEGNPYEQMERQLIASGLSPEEAQSAVRKKVGVEGRQGTIKAPIPEGSKAKKGLKYDAATDQVVDQDTATRYARGQKDAPPEVQAMFQGNTAATALKQKNAERLANVRGQSYGLNRPISVLDSASGNAPTEVTMNDIKKNPGRYVPSGPGQTALAQENLMQDIAGTSQQARTAINALTPQEDFPLEMRTKLAIALRDNDPGGAIGQLVSSGALGSLSARQQDFVIALNQLTENAMAMRSVLKTGQGAEDVRAAIRNTLPGILSPDKNFALRQLDAFDKTLARLHRGVPRVQLNEATTPGTLRNNARQTAGRAPAPGTVEDGYRFKGGDPSVQSNWEQVR